MVVCCNACPRVPLNGCFLGVAKNHHWFAFVLLCGYYLVSSFCITSIGDHSPIQSTKKLTKQFDVSSVNGVHAVMRLSKTQYFLSLDCAQSVAHILLGFWWSHQCKWPGSHVILY